MTTTTTAAVGAARGSSRPRALPAVIGTLAGMLLGVVLLVSTYTKAIDPGGFAAQITRDGLMPAGLAFPAGVFVIALEAALGVALLLGLRRPSVLVLTTVMMAGFLGLAGWQWVFPPEDPSSCGCFGNLVQQSPGQHVAVNSLFLLLALVAWAGRPRGGRLAAILVCAIAFAGALGFTLAAPSLAIDHWPGATRLAEGARADELGLIEIVPELDAGRHLVLLIDRADEATRLDVARINETIVLAGAPLQVWGLAEENPELEMEFFFAAGPAFDVRGAPYGTLKPLYRSLPRAFLVEDGRVGQVWNAIPDEATLRSIAEGGVS